MQKKFFITASLAGFLLTTLVWAEPSSGEKALLDQVIKSAITDLVEDNAAFSESKPAKHFQEFQDIQSPRVTMVLCSDSRVQTNNFSEDGAENDIFIARNIGNQFITTKGSVEYGVDVLNTPVLIFVGHSHCGAIKAARGNFDEVSPAIHKELQTLDVTAAHDDKEGVVLNVHHQVKAALSDFKKKVESGKLVIIGAVYDFRNDYGYGNGQLIIVNLNGEQNPQKIRNSHYFDNLKKVSIGVQSARAIPNPASQNCIEKGGNVLLSKRGDGGIYGICVFEDNRQCEEWALFRGECPVGGLKITGYVTPEGTYCALRGGQVRENETLCDLPSGKTCSTQDLYSGKCV